MVVDSRILQLTLLSESLSRRDIANTVERERKDGRRAKSGQQRGNETGLSEVGFDGLDTDGGVVRRGAVLSCSELDGCKGERKNDWCEDHGGCCRKD